MLDPLVVVLSQVSLAIIFALSAAGKLRAPDEFLGVVENYRLLPEAAVRPVACALPLVEAAVALGLLAGPTRPHAAAGALGLLALFSAAIAVNLARGRREIDCGCFGPLLRQRLSWWLVGRNGLLALMAAACLPGAAAPRPLAWLDLVTAIAAAIALTALYLSASYLLSAAPSAAALWNRGGSDA